MTVDTLYSFKAMVAANGDKNFHAADYLHYVFQVIAGDDLLATFAEILNPEIVEIEGCLLVASVGAIDRFKRNRDNGLSPPVAQYWANLWEISGLFKEENAEAEKRLCVAIANCWNACLKEKGYAQAQSARFIEDKFAGERYVCLADWTIAP